MGDGAAGRVLVVNCGSSTVKLAVVDPDTGERPFAGLADRVGTPDASVRVGTTTRTPDDTSHRGALAVALEELPDDVRSGLVAVGHRIVHGGARFTRSVVVDDDVLAELRGLTDLAPLHVAPGVAGIEAALSVLPDLPQVTVFDTAFHQTMPERAYRYAVPEDWYAEHGVRRYGFHGTSHRYVTAVAAEVLDRPLESLRLVSAHLGNGCSAAAVLHGRSVDTTMGLTPLEGLVMGTRSGDIDPAVVEHMARRLGVSAAEVVALLNRESGLLGVSGHRDMRELEAAALAGDAPAQLALELFCYRLAKHVAGLTVALGGLDALVFTGGIGENSTGVRARVQELLAHLGVRADEGANAVRSQEARRVSAPGSPVDVLVIPTDEELVIARDARELVGAAR
ncbi:acetate kinase [Motilibacter peucedani]|uniref:Acetate kinase n=1 Tax=Motilibacter peucedani TaxID=598650 RepID=A0A420XKG2_9ACTN|nr:acetate kinase [Motilibacter peucedani]RKS68569.1 acetate kinase [Motilibacter peucedani]